MRTDPEQMEAKGLQKEMNMFLRYASREGAPKCEVDYYQNLAFRTKGKINWKALDGKKKKVERREDYD